VGYNDPMSTIYKDGLVEITAEEIVFRCYCFPFGGDEHVPLSQIESVQAKQPSILFGSWRIGEAGLGRGSHWMAPSRTATGYLLLSDAVVFSALDSQSRIPGR